jgi:hypothetical protein
LRGDIIFTYDINKRLDLEDLEYEEKEKAKARKKERRNYSRDIVKASQLSEDEIRWLKDDFRGAAIVDENGFVERICMPNIFDLIFSRNYH